jgi:hypothetical protein
VVGEEGLEQAASLELTLREHNRNHHFAAVAGDALAFEGENRREDRLSLQHANSSSILLPQPIHSSHLSVSMNGFSPCGGPQSVSTEARSWHDSFPAGIDHLTLGRRDVGP